MLWTHSVFFLCYRMREVDLGSGRALLIKEHGEFSAMGHKCPHYGAPLVKGESLILTFLIIYNMIHLTSFSLSRKGHICRYRCAVKRTRALSLARCMFQHCNRRHRGLPRAGQPAYLPGDLPRWWCLLTHFLPYHISKHRQKVYTSLMSVCSRSELKRTRSSFVQTSR